MIKVIKLLKVKHTPLQKYHAGTPELITFGTRLDTSNHCFYICFLKCMSNKYTSQQASANTVFLKCLRERTGQTDLKVLRKTIKKFKVDQYFTNSQNPSP